MTKHEMAVASAFTGICFGKFEYMREYAEKLLGRPIFTHEFGSDAFSKELKEKSKNDFKLLFAEPKELEELIKLGLLKYI